MRAHPSPSTHTARGVPAARCSPPRAQRLDRSLTLPIARTHVRCLPLLPNPGQVCASGALLNIVGPDLDAQPRQPGGPGAQRRGLGRLMALAMAAAAIHDCVFERQPELS